MEAGVEGEEAAVITYNAKRFRLELICLPPYSSLSGKMVVALCKGAIVYRK